MYDWVLIMSGLRNIEKSLLHILDRTSWIETVDDFLKTPAGVDALDIAAIRLMAVGEEIKKIEKRSGGELLSRYPEIEWRDIMGFRDFIAHAYFHIDASVVFDTVQNNIHPLLTTIQQIIADLEKQDHDED
ncbi:MAG TPA: antitoxin [Porphyromonadaceae bacterium]|nr:antitoxin [Porphyromonadaceae bacterium]